MIGSFCTCKPPRRISGEAIVEHQAFIAGETSATHWADETHGDDPFRADVTVEGQSLTIGLRRATPVLWRRSTRRSRSQSGGRVEAEKDNEEGFDRREDPSKAAPGKKTSKESSPKPASARAVQRSRRSLRTRRRRQNRSSASAKKAKTAVRPPKSETAGVGHGKKATPAEKKPCRRRRNLRRPKKKRCQPNQERQKATKSWLRKA